MRVARARRGRRSGGVPATVHLVGAGPGAWDLITVRGLDRLKRARVVVYDGLVSAEILRQAPAEAELIQAAKSPGRHRVTQEEINDLLVNRARAGLTVVRLKGGDPFVFGRGGEEALVLRRAGVPFEIVPGMSSAVGVPAASGIPVTHRGVADGFAVWTAHREGGSEGHIIDAPTQVVLMGLRSLRATVSALMAAGRSPSTPAAVVSKGTTREQRTVLAGLADLPEAVESRGLESPATLIVGDVVALAGMIHHGEDLEDSGRPARAEEEPGRTLLAAVGLGALAAE